MTTNKFNMIKIIRIIFALFLITSQASTLITSQASMAPSRSSLKSKLLIFKENTRVLSSSSNPINVSTIVYTYLGPDITALFIPSSMNSSNLATLVKNAAAFKQVTIIPAGFEETIQSSMQLSNIIGLYKDGTLSLADVFEQTIKTVAWATTLSQSIIDGSIF